MPQQHISDQQLQGGEHVLVASDSWLVAAWEIGPSDQFDTPIDGPRSLGQLMREIKDGKVTPTQAPGAEPTSGYP